MARVVGFSTLPDQVAYNVLETLQDTDICNVSAVNKRYRVLVGSDTFWQNLCLKRFGIPLSGGVEEKGFTGSWKLFYIFLRNMKKCSTQTGTSDLKSIIVAAVRNGYEDIFTHCIKSMRKSNLPLDLNEILLVAASNGRTKIAKTLLEYGANINTPSETGQTPIFLAKQRDLVYFLLQRGAKTNIFDANGLAPIHYHAENGDIEALKCMIDGDTVNMKSSSGASPLIYAAAKGHLHIVKFLLNVGASINQPNVDGRTPLHSAAHSGSQETVTFLLQKNAKLNVVDKNENSPMDVAVAAGHYQIAFELLQKSGKIIDYQEFINCKETRVGGGAFAEVYGILWRDKMVALKKVRYNKLIEAGKTPEWVLQKFILEVALMSKLNSNTYFVPLYGAVIQPPHLYLVLEYMAGGSLFTVLSSDSDTFLGHMPPINQLALNIASGVAYLHSLKPQIIHRDLTSQNVLISYEGIAKIADFGISRFIDEIKTMTSIGNPRWRAPEVTKAQRYSEKVDVFGFGFILYELFARAPPFTHVLDPNQVAYFVALGQRPTIPPNCPPEWATLITQCWNDNAALRPSFSVILETLPSLPLAYIPLRNERGGGGEAFEIVPYY